MLSQIWRAAGPATSAPKPALGITTTTTYLGSSHGAKEANTDVAWLPTTSAVPVLAATQTRLSGKPPKVPAAVPPVTTPASACLMYASVDFATGRCPVTGGVIFRTVLPSALISASPTRGL